MISFKLIKGSFFDLAREKGGGRGMSRIHIIVRGGERVLEVWLERKEKKKELQRKINRAVKKRKALWYACCASWKASNNERC